MKINGIEIDQKTVNLFYRLSVMTEEVTGIDYRIRKGDGNVVRLFKEALETDNEDILDQLRELTVVLELPVLYYLSDGTHISKLHTKKVSWGVSGG
jgi:hypothetical protein